MKNIFALAFLSSLTVQLYSQFTWRPIIDNNSLFVNDRPICALHSDSFMFPQNIYLGGRPNHLTSTLSGSDCCAFTFYSFGTQGYFTSLDCAPISPIDTAYVMNFSSAGDTVYNHSFFTVGGSFRDESCTLPGHPADLKNLIVYADGSPAWYLPVMECSDTIFAAVALADYDNPCPTNPENYFRTYVAAKCVFCDCSNVATMDSARFVAFYDPMNSCTSMQAINYMQGGTNGPVYALQVLDTANVYAAGRFDSAGPISVNNIAKWNGVSWDSLGSGINGIVKVLQWYHGKLYAGGNFTLAGGVAANNIAVWDGTTWSAVGAGTNGIVNALTIHDGELFAGGNFTSAGSISVNFVAKWDGSGWSDLSGGRNGEVYSLASFSGGLYVGGDFTGGQNDTTKYFALFIDTTLAISEAPIPEAEIFPNPSNGKFTLKSTTAVSSVEILSMMGEVVFSQYGETSEMQIDLQGKLPGVYFVHIFSEESASVQKLILQTE